MGDQQAFEGLLLVVGEPDYPSTHFKLYYGTAELHQSSMAFFVLKELSRNQQFSSQRTFFCQHSRLQSIKGFCLKAGAVVADKLDVFPQKETD